VADAERRAVLLSGPAGRLAVDAVFGALNEFKPTLLLQGVAHGVTLPTTLQAFTAATVHPGVGDAYLSAAPMAPVKPSRAVVTTHPGRGLDWLLGLWCANIHPRVPSAELHVYSAVLDQGALGATIPERLRPVLEQALAGEAQGVRLKRPRADPEMADAYRQARAHLYPGSDRDVLCSTLAESQAVGLPAVARPLGAADERLRNGESGYLAPDDDAVVNLAVCLLQDRDIFNRLSEQARAGRKGATWDRAAEEIEHALARPA
jgi:glycosyltransferase involved in cell wall biosynthesis